MWTRLSSRRRAEVARSVTQRLSRQLTQPSRTGSTPRILNWNTILSIGTCEVDSGYLVDHKRLVKEWRPCVGDRAYHQRLLIDDIVVKSGTVKYAIIDGLDEKFDDAYVSRVDQRIDFLGKNQVKVIVFFPHIKANRSLKSCFARPLKPTAATCELSVDVRKTINIGFARLVARVSADHPNVKFFDQNELFCDSRKCALILDGMPLFRDEYSHYSEYASFAVAEMFVKWAKLNAPDILRP